MKNKIKIMAVLILMISFAITSCKKEDAVPANSSNSTELSQHSQKVLSLISRFDAKMKSSLKEDEQIHLDSVIWNTEALQNYSYAFPDSSTRDFLVFKDNYTLSIDQNQMVLLSDVQALQSQMENDYLAHYNSIEELEKVLHFCDVALDSVMGSTAFISATHGFGLTLLLGSYPPFAEDDDWIWGTLGEEYGNPPAGKCDGTMYGVSDGSNELEWRLNSLNNQPTSQYRRFTDVETKLAYPDDFPSSNGTRIYSDPTCTSNKCLQNQDLTYYLVEADDIVFTYGNPPLGLRPTGKDFMSINIFDDLFGTLIYAHCYEVTYGIPYWGTYSPE